MVGVRGTADQAARPETWIPTWVEVRDEVRGELAASDGLAL